MGNLALCTSPNQTKNASLPTKNVASATGTKTDIKGLPQQEQAAEKIAVKSVVVTPYGEGVVTELRGDVVVIELNFGAKAYMRVEEVKVRPGSVSAKPIASAAAKSAATSFAASTAVPNLRVFPGAAVNTPFGKGYVQATRGNGTAFVVILAFGATAYLRSEIVDLVPLECKPNDRVATKYGGGILEVFREDGSCLVKFDFGGRGYLRTNEVSSPTPYSIKKEEEMKIPSSSAASAEAAIKKPTTASPSPAKSSPASEKKKGGGGSPSKGASPAGKKSEASAAAPPPMEPLPAAAASPPAKLPAPAAAALAATVPAVAPPAAVPAPVAPAPAPPKEEPAPAAPDEEKDEEEEEEEAAGGAASGNAAGNVAGGSASGSQANKKKKKKKGKN